MPCPTLAALPPPPPGKTGWPWTEGTPSLSEAMPAGAAWPRVSIVTPSFNQGQYLEETIRSVLLQGYPNLEYIVIDGGSTDDSVEIIRKYEPWLAYWVSEPDRGQSHAINKGFERATGDIYAWLNSDDIYEPGAALAVSRYFNEHDDCHILYGNGWFVDQNGSKTSKCDWVRPFDRDFLVTHDFILQPALFWRSQVWRSTGVLDDSYYWGMDWEWKIRATRYFTPHYLQSDLACWRLIPGVKTLSPDRQRLAELASITRRHGGFWRLGSIVREADRLANWMDEKVTPEGKSRIPQYPLTVIRLVLNKLYSHRYA